ncbi:MAG: outer membrane beta-barrel protein [Pseudomonadota bacterium]
MNKTKSLSLYWIGIAALGAVLVNPAAAQDNRYFYWGLGAGQSHSQIDEAQTTNRLLNTPNNPGAFDSDRSEPAYKIFGGYQLQRNFAVEAGYFNLGKFSNSTALPAGRLNNRNDIEGVNVDLVGTMPFSDKWTGLARVGAQHTRTHSSFDGPGLPLNAVSSSDQHANNLKVGLGIQYEITPSVQLRAEAERFRVKDGVGNLGDINYYSLSVVFPVGRSASQRVSSLTPRPSLSMPRDEDVAISR